MANGQKTLEEDSMYRRIVLMVLATLALVAGLALALGNKPAAAQQSCTLQQQGPYIFDISYPAPSKATSFKVPEGGTTVVELKFAPVGKPWLRYIYIPARSAESGNRRFRIENGWSDYSEYKLWQFGSGCSYEQIMRRMAMEAARHSNDDVSWTLPWADDYGIVQPEEPGAALPITHLMWPCEPEDHWKSVDASHWIPQENRDLRWQLTYEGRSAYGSYTGFTAVGPARLTYFWGVCDANRWWEPFAFADMAKEERIPTGGGLQFNPYLFVEGRLFLPGLDNW